MTGRSGGAGTKPAPRVIDLDRARKARAEKNGEPVTLRLGGKDFALPAEMPIEFALQAAEGEMRNAIAALLGDQVDAFFAMQPSLGDFAELAEQAGAVYGIELGDTSASPSS